MKIAIASSGLGHVARGIETWACDTAVALAEVSGKLQVASGQNTNNESPITNKLITVTLFSGAPLDAGRSHLSACGGDRCYIGNECSTASIRVLPCLKRGDGLTRMMARLAPGFTWRWGWKSTYDIEQRSFWRHLWPILRDEGYDILHVQDPLLADLCRRYREAGKLKTKEILAHGTEETPEFLARFPYVQHLAPWHLEQMGEGKPEIESRIQNPEVIIGKVGDVTTDEHGCTLIGRKCVAIPNFVDCEAFAPVGEGKVDEASRLVSLNEQKAIRQRMGIPPDAFVIGCVAAVKKHHKRVDYLIREFASYNAIRVHQCSSVVPFLLLMGAKTDETGELIDLAESLIPGRYKILTNIGRDRMPELYRAMDVFVLTSLFEMMPIALLEALASGLPCVVNRHPVLEWMVGVKEGKPETGNLRPESEGKGGERGKPETGNLRPESEGVGGKPETGNLRPESESRIQKSEVRDVTTDEHRLTQIPLTHNSHPEAGGISIDMSREGVLAAALAGLTPDWIAEHGRQARDRAVRMFSKQAVIGQYVAYYRKVIGGG